MSTKSQHVMDLMNLLWSTQFNKSPYSSHELQQIDKEVKDALSSLDIPEHLRTRSEENRKEIADCLWRVCTYSYNRGIAQTTAHFDKAEEEADKMRKELEKLYKLIGGGMEDLKDELRRY